MAGIVTDIIFYGGTETCFCFEDSYAIPARHSGESTFEKG
jgi:hypothetical protein